MTFMVVATQQGVCKDHILREVGEVFELKTNEDGTYPVREEWVAKLGPDGKQIGDEGEYVQLLDQDGNPMHRDYAPDMGEQMMRAGPKRGEVSRFGWHKRVPDDTEAGIYPEGHRFGNVAQAPQPRRAPIVERIDATPKYVKPPKRFG